MLLTSYGLGDVALNWSYFCLYCAQFASESTAVSWSYEQSDPDLAVQSCTETASLYLLKDAMQSELGHFTSKQALRL